MNLPAQEKATLYTFDAGYIETMLGEGNWNACWEYMGGVIENLTITASSAAHIMSMQLEQDMKDESRKQYVNDFGALLGELFMFLLKEESITLSDLSFEKLIYYHETLHTLFYIYDLDGTDEAVKNMLATGKRLSQTQQKKLLLLLSLNTKLDINEILNLVEPKYRLSALISYLAQRKIFRENVYNNKIKLYSFRKELEKAHTNIDAFKQTTNVFFMCSYLNYSDKHKIKENINVAFRNHISSTARDQRRIKNLPIDQSNLILDQTRPTVLVMAELFARNHAMYRCYGSAVNALHSEFNVVLAMPGDKADITLKDDFPNYLTFNQLGEFYKIIHNVKPDILFLPSVGMCAYSVIAANMREAPIQMMSLGHPATPMSDKIDYVMGPSDLYDEKAFPNDKYIADGDAKTFLPIIAKEKFFAPIETNETGPKKIIKVAVVGTDIKVTYAFFRLLKEIVAESPFKIHVTFMMGVGGIDSLYIEKYLKENFENSTYYGWQSYESYLNNIKTVDVILNPFPFGHTNTIIDTLMCGKPCIGLEGIEPAAKTEAYVLKMAGLEEQFVAKDEQEYKDKFFAIADRILKGDTDFYDREDAYNQIFKPAPAEDYGRVFKWILDNHTKLKASKKKYFDIFEEV